MPATTGLTTNSEAVGMGRLGVSLEDLADNKLVVGQRECPVSNELLGVRSVDQRR